MSNDVYITGDFLLETELARELYHGHAASLPIIDYHCHLPPAEIAADRRWENLSQVWLNGDHYKWRAMRANGVPERFCTGDASDREKFDKWAGTVPYLVRNPLYDWTHLELKQYFGISDRLLGPDTADGIWDASLKRLAEADMSCRGLMKQSNVVLVCTTDDPADSLEHHLNIAADDAFDIRVLPAWRPDKGMCPEDPAAFNAWIDRLAAAADIDIRDFTSYLEALRKRHAFFHEQGCRLSDHGLETIYAEPCRGQDAAAIFGKVRNGAALCAADILKFKSAMLVEFAVLDHEKGWTQQFHLGALRNVNSAMSAQLGPDTGFDAVADCKVAKPLGIFLDRLASRHALTRTILYDLDPGDNLRLVTMMGCFQDGSVPGKMQFGSGWWHLDQKDGMEQQMRDLANTGLLSRFVGMLTDSRSFLSYTRHDYFRRILCNLLGNDAARGVVPNDVQLLGRMVRDISYCNAANYFGFDVPADV